MARGEDTGYHPNRQVGRQRVGIGTHGQSFVREFSPQNESLSGYSVEQENMGNLKATYKDMRKGTNVSGNNPQGVKTNKDNARSIAITKQGKGATWVQDAYGSRLPGLSPYYKDL